LGLRGNWDIFVTYIYNWFNVDSNYAYAAALSFIVFLILVMFSSFWRKTIKVEGLTESTEEN
ncbi:MAG TPA: hypothetical protein VJ044_18370, partial [Candidatus Hodarchaeales archaeon]|nr:hypothetical protein [Candidatus Hodarchaeales archaeon]